MKLDPDLTHEDDVGLWPAVRRPIIVTCCLFAAAVFTIIAWAAFAPLENGALGQGVVMAAGDRRAVQHLEGGIIGKVLVQEGDLVQADQALFEIDDERANAAFQAALYASRSLQATMARLDAEAGRQREIAFPTDLLDLEKADPAVASLLSGERALFSARQAALESRASIIQQQITQLNEQISGLGAQVNSIEQQLALIADELADVKKLLDKGLERRTRYSALLRGKADLEGQEAQAKAAIASAQQRVAELELRITSDLDDFLDRTADERSKTRSDLSVQGERVRAAKDVLARTVIRAPITGRVMDIRIKTPGPVLKPGETIAEIIPTELPLVVQARFNTIYLDSVRPGQDAQVKLTAFNAHETPIVMGQVMSIAPDRTVDERSGVSYFVVNVQVPTEQTEKLGGRSALTSGMPAEVVVVLGEQTALGQIFQPLTDIIWRSFKTG